MTRENFRHNRFCQSTRLSLRLMQACAGCTALLLLLPLTLHARGLSQEAAGRFVRLLAAGSDSLDDCVLPAELALAKRLGTTYRSVKHKFLIGYDLEPEIKAGILEGSLDCTVSVRSLEDNFSLLSLRVPQKDCARSYYLREGLLVSPLFYHARNWPQRETRYFRFYLSDTTGFNSYAADRLESFLEAVLEGLELTAQEKQRLESGKIICFRCADQDEIELLTGFRSRGMGILAYDYVATTFNCHYHELVHLLVNFKLRDPDLYTHPFLQEGLAVALGGRGGKEPGVIHDLGYFLARSGLQDYRELLDPGSFAAQDPSMSYPVSGLYSLFLLQALGLEGYLGLYRKYSGPLGSVSGTAIAENDLPAPRLWQEFLDSYTQYANISFAGAPAEAGPFWQQDGSGVFEAGDSYFFRTGDALLIGPPDPATGRSSARFAELFPAAAYRGEKYLVLADPAEVKVYNLWADNLAANFVCGFSFTAESVPATDGFFGFYVRKAVFDEPLESLTISRLPGE
ncbi:MAG: hypothetical protein JXQ83_02320 [Candidatus Glassbacteria bacterium]|nr:hypothetical protein [Candidatus Glassbacteria bacterium]